MPPEAKKNASVILFDLKMDRNKSIKILDEIILHMSIVNPKDVTRLVLLNCEQSQNQKKFKNVYEVTTEVTYTFDLLNCIEDIEIADCNWLDGLELSATILSEYMGRNAIFTKQLIMISELNYPPLEENSEKRIKKINKLLQDCNVHLYLIGPETIPGVTVCNKADIRSNMENLQFRSTECKAEESQRIIKDIIKGVEAIICGPDLGIDYLCYYNNTIPKQAWEVPLTIEDFEFPTTTTRLVTPVKYPQMKRLDSPEIKWKGTTGDIDAGEREFHYSDLVKVYSFMDKIVTLPDDVKESFKYKGNKMFKLVGFVNSTDIPEIYFGGEEVYSVHIKPNNPKAQAFYHLVKSTHEKKKYGLALRAYNNNNAPKLYILVPKLPCEFTMVLHPEIVTDICSERPAKHNPAEVNDKRFEAYSAYLSNLAKKTLPLHPSASAGVYHKQYLNNVIGLIKDSVDVKVKIEDMGKDERENLEKVKNLFVVKEELNTKGLQMQTDDVGNVKQEEEDDDDDEW